MPETRKHRPLLRLPAVLLQECAEGADDPETGFVLTDFIHSAIITATKAAEAGQGELLPRRQPRNRPAPAGGVTPSRYTASRAEAARCAAALAAVGSSVRVVVIAALEALRAARFVWLDATLPGEAGWAPPEGFERAGRLAA
ncbi:hypothetical protein [Pseudonocardia sp. T1-2H]|uniref:hypothetical protein n=1 Tax=Pseudonocardia sp. T1-2H TaxID=3128899 RepID=UPI0031012E89